MYYIIFVNTIWMNCKVTIKLILLLLFAHLRIKPLTCKRFGRFHLFVAQFVKTPLTIYTLVFIFQQCGT